jgi:hypothetical protein
MGMEIKRHDSERCSYKCPFYKDGAAYSYCKRFWKVLKYDGKIPPLLTDECKEMVEPPDTGKERG